MTSNLGKKSVRVRNGSALWPVALACIAVAGAPLCAHAAIEVVILDEASQGSGICASTFFPVTTLGLPASFTMTSQTGIDDTAPLDPDAIGSSGMVVLDAIGSGAQKFNCTGATDISGSDSNKDEELAFWLDGPVHADTIVVSLSGIDFSVDDPVIFISSSSSAGFDYTITEAEIQGAFLSTGTATGDFAFWAFTSLRAVLLIFSFMVR